MWMEGTEEDARTRGKRQGIGHQSYRAVNFLLDTCHLRLATYSTVTLFARFLGRSTLQPRRIAMW